MILIAAVAGLLLQAASAPAPEQKQPLPSFDYEATHAHEIKPHRRTIPLEGVEGGTLQLHIKLTISPKGDVLHSEADSGSGAMEYWPRVREEVNGWKFDPFEQDGKPVTAEAEEYVDLVPPERLPKVHVPAPPIRRRSKIVITLSRSGCFGSCPSYKVTLTSGGSVLFDGGSYVVAAGQHTDRVKPADVRELARQFVADDFYSLDNKYVALVTDNPGYDLSISIDGHAKEVVDYVGTWEGMPHVVSDLEDAVDELSRDKRWIDGADGLVDSLKAEGYKFKSWEAQVILKQAAQRGHADTVQELLDAGVPLEPLAPPKMSDPDEVPAFDHVGWLNAASSNPAALKVLVDAGASQNDQSDMDLALLKAARSGKLEAVRELIDYGADPNADFSNSMITEEVAGGTMGSEGGDAVLIEAARSGKPEVVAEILKYHPDINARDRDGETALFAAGDSLESDVDGDRVKIVRMLVSAGADVNARDNDGNTPLHGIFLTDVEEELLKLGADVNAKNDDGETPIFTNVDDDSIALFLKYGANLDIRDNKGQTVLEAAQERGPARTEALRKAIEARSQKQAQP